MTYETKRVNVLVTLDMPEHYTDEQIIKSMNAHLLPGKAHTNPTLTVIKESNEQAS